MKTWFFNLLFCSCIAFGLALLPLAPAVEADEEREVPNYAGLIGCFPLPPIPTPTPLFDKPVPLTAIDVNITVKAWVSDITATLHYRNELTQAIETEFVLPMAENAAVYKLEAVMAGTRVIRGQVKNRTEAERVYEEAVDAGKASVLLRSQKGSPDIYKLSLGNLDVGEDAIVTISFAQPMDRNPDTGELTVTLPVVLNPRYTPRPELPLPEAAEPRPLSDVGENFNDQTGFVAISDVDYEMGFEATVDMGANGPEITSIETGNDDDELDVQFVPGNKKAIARLTSKFVQDHDFQLRVQVEELPGPVVYMEPGYAPGDEPSSWNNLDVAGAWLEPLPKTFGTETGGQYWFVVDRSGSMSGTKIANARQTLLLLLKSLPLDCEFNVVGFGSRFDKVFDSGTAPYNNTNLATAQSYAQSMNANFGGTEILTPLRHIYQNTELKGRRSIFVLTDGEVSNTQQVLDLAQENAGNTQVFSVGIGHGVSTALVNGIARVSGGMAELVRDSGDQLNEKVVNLLEASMLPSVRDIDLKWLANGASIATKVPEEIPLAAFKGRAMSQYALFNRTTGVAMAGQATLTGKMAGRATQYNESFAIPSSEYTPRDEPLPLHRLAAKAKLTELMDKYSRTRDPEIKREAEELSIATGVVCEFTALVGVDESGHVVNSSDGNNPLLIRISRPSSHVSTPSPIRPYPMAPVFASFGGVAGSGGMLGMPGMPGPRGPPLGASYGQPARLPMPMVPSMAVPPQPPVSVGRPSFDASMQGRLVVFFVLLFNYNNFIDLQ